MCAGICAPYCQCDAAREVVRPGVEGVVMVRRMDARLGTDDARLCLTRNPLPTRTV